MNQTLQDRLVKELRLRGISTMDAGNAFLLKFMADFNGRFSRSPRSPYDAHRPLQPTDQLDRIFCTRTARSMTANLADGEAASWPPSTPALDRAAVTTRRRFRVFVFDSSRRFRAPSDCRSAVEVRARPQAGLVLVPPHGHGDAIRRDGHGGLDDRAVVA